MDLCDDKSIEAAFAQGREQSGGFDVLINNAGSAYYAPAEDLNIEAIADTMHVLFEAPLKLSHLAWPDLVKKKGRIIYITSLATQLPIPYHAAYNAAKSALSAYIRTGQIENPRPHVKVIEVIPGDIATRFHERALEATGHMAVNFHENASGSDKRIAMKKAIENIGRRLASSPSADLVARVIEKLCVHPHPPDVVYVGSFFQTVIASRAAKILPRKAIDRLIRLYYGLSI